jgi:hypothetical protein
MDDSSLTGGGEDSRSSVAPADHRSTMKALDIVQSMLGSDGQASRRHVPSKWVPRLGSPSRRRDQNGSDVAHTRGIHLSRTRHSGRQSSPFGGLGNITLLPPSCATAKREWRAQRKLYRVSDRSGGGELRRTLSFASFSAGRRVGARFGARFGGGKGQPTVAGLSSGGQYVLAHRQRRLTVAGPAHGLYTGGRAASAAAPPTSQRNGRGVRADRAAEGRRDAASHQAL